MYKILISTAAIASLAACEIKYQDEVIDPDVTANVAELAEFGTLQRQANGDVLLTAGDEEITLSAEEILEISEINDGSDGFFSYQGGQSMWYAVAFQHQTNDVEVAGGIVQTGNGDLPVFSSFSGLNGQTTSTPTTGSTNYAGLWGLGYETDHQDVHSDFGGLTLNHDFENNAITGSGTSFYERSGPESAPVLFVDAAANADGSIAGTVTFSAYSDTDLVADLEAGFFGEDAAQIAGAFSGDGIGGILHAERGATVPEPVLGDQDLRF